MKLYNSFKENIYLLSINPVFSQQNTAILSKVDSLVYPLVVTNNYSGTVLIAREGKIIYLKLTVK